VSNNIRSSSCVKYSTNIRVRRIVISRRSPSTVGYYSIDALLIVKWSNKISVYGRRLDGPKLEGPSTVQRIAGKDDDSVASHRTRDWCCWRWRLSYLSSSISSSSSSNGAKALALLPGQFYTAIAKLPVLGDFEKWNGFQFDVEVTR